MKAVVVTELTEPENLSVSEAPEPELGRDQVLVDVKAAGCNFFDTLIIRGRYQVKPSLPFSPGGEVAGVVARVGADVSNVAVGTRVALRVGHGGFAERVVSPPSALLKIPDRMSFVEAAAFPIVYGTAYVALCQRGALRPGESVLVTAAAGGVGLATVQIAHAMGARVIALASGDKLDVAREAGAAVCIDYRRDGWVDAVRRATDGRGADVIVENVGGTVFEGCMKCIAWAGRIVVSGFASGKIPAIAANRVMLKHVSVVGVHFGPMAEHQPDLVRDAYRGLFDMYERGEIRPIISETFPLERVAEALGALGERRTTGKIVLTL